MMLGISMPRECHYKERRAKMEGFIKNNQPHYREDIVDTIG